MDENQSTIPPLRQVVTVILLTFFLFSMLVLLLNGRMGKWGLWITEGAFILPALGFVLLKKYDVKTVFRLKAVSLPALVVSAGIGLGLTLLTEEIDRLIQGWMPIPEDLWQALAETMRWQSQTEMIVMIMAVIVTASLVEEMLFRGMLQGALENRVDVNKAVMTTALFFAAIHFNPWWAVEIFFLGVLIGVLAWKSQSIFPGAVVHAVNNGIALYMMNSDEAKFNFLYRNGHVAPQWILFGLISVAAGFWLFYAICDSKKKIDLKV